MFLLVGMLKKYIPKVQFPLDRGKVFQAVKYLRELKPFLVITGAGISTESGIPDYRSEGVGLYATSKSRPIQYQEFINKPDARKRYWARNYVGWPRFSSTSPNFSHFLLRKWEETGFISSVLTQNVDNLHHKAGSTSVIELHGSSYQVCCLSCKFRTSRYAFQNYISSLNPAWISIGDALAPDGDVHVNQQNIDSFITPNCPICNGVVKPNVVFFGENVPSGIAKRSCEEVKRCESVLVIGSSLETFSAYRYIREAHKIGKPIVILNIGKTRADNVCTVKIEYECSKVLSEIDKFLS